MKIPLFLFNFSRTMLIVHIDFENNYIRNSKVLHLLQNFTSHSFSMFSYLCGIIVSVIVSVDDYSRMSTPHWFLLDNTYMIRMTVIIIRLIQLNGYRKKSRVCCLLEQHYWARYLKNDC